MPPAAQRSASRPPTERAALGTRLDVTIGSIADIRPRPAAKSPLPAQAADGSDTASAMQARLTALLRDRTGLQAALLVSEILAPPVGWRDLP